MTYDIRTIAFLAEILHPPTELQPKTIQSLHAELFDHPELAYRNFALAPDGIHLSNPVDRPHAVSSASFLPDRIQFREELTGKTVDEFGARVQGIVTQASQRIGVPLITAQQYVVRSLLNPRHYPDSRDFLAKAVCRLEDTSLQGFGRSVGLFGLKLVFPQTPEQPNLFSMRLESFQQDPRSIFVENLGTFTHCMLPAGVDDLVRNLHQTYDFLAQRATTFLARFDHAREGGQ